MTNPFRYFNSSPEVIRLVVMMYVRYPLSARNVEDLLAERGIDISYETVRFWWNRFGPVFAAEIRKKRVAHMRGYPRWRWHVDEVFVKVNGALRYLWRAVDHEGEVLEAVVTAKRDKAAALKLLKRITKRHGQPPSVVTDGLRLILRRWMRSGLPIDTRSDVTSIIERRTRISQFDDESERCSGFEASRLCKSSAQFTPSSTIISIRSGISSHGRSTSNNARPLAEWRAFAA
jgi:transposase-like protein